MSDRNWDRMEELARVVVDAICRVHDDAPRLVARFVADHVAYALAGGFEAGDLEMTADICEEIARFLDGETAALRRTLRENSRLSKPDQV